MLRPAKPILFSPPYQGAPLGLPGSGFKLSAEGVGAAPGWLITGPDLGN
jgi:hypothetical protein